MTSKNIAEIHDSQTLKIYEAMCSCGGRECNQRLSLEVDIINEKNDAVPVSLTTLTIEHTAVRIDTYGSGFFSRLWARLRCALGVLLTGHVAVVSDFVFRDEAVQDYIEALQDAHHAIHRYVKEHQDATPKL